MTITINKQKIHDLRVAMDAGDREAFSPLIKSELENLKSPIVLAALCAAEASGELDEVIQGMQAEAEKRGITIIVIDYDAAPTTDNSKLN